MFEIGKAKFEVIDFEVPYEGKPTASDVTAIGTLTTYKVTTSDLSALKFGVVTWEDDTSEAIPIDFLDGEQKYERLERAGRLTLINFEGSWIAELNAMKFNPEKGRSNLASATYEEISEFAESDLKVTLERFGSVSIGTREQLHGETNRNRLKLSLKCDKGNKDAIAATYVVTRVLATLKDFGM